MDEQKIERQNDTIDLSHLFREFWPVLRRFFWIPLLLSLLLGAFWLLRSWRAYTPMYASEVTFTIQVNTSGTSDISGGTSYYDKATAEQLSKTFPYLLQSDLFYAKLRQAMGVDYINGSITASTVTNTNLFTLRVTSSSAQNALTILEKVVEIYPQAADYVIGNTSMNLLTQPVLATEPYNAFSPRNSAIKGALLGLVAGLALLVLIAAARKTVCTVEDVHVRLNQECLAALPAVAVRYRKNRQLSISNRHIPAAYQESVRALRVKLLRKLGGSEKKVILLTSTMPGEGKTTVAINLAQSLSRNGARVVLIDADLRKPTVKWALGINEPSHDLLEAIKAPESVTSLLLEYEHDSLWILAGDEPQQDVRKVNARRLERLLDILREQADYIILDTPPCGLLADSVNIARAADCVVYVLGAGAVQVPQVLDAMQFLNETGTPVAGCVLNGLKGASNEYGYRYGKYRYEKQE